MGKNKKSGFIPPVQYDLNFNTYWDYFNRLKEYAINMFEWVNLPDTIDPRYLELQLFMLGYVCFFKTDITNPNNSGINLPDLGDNEGTYLCLQCTLGGRFNVYNLPTQYHIYTASGFTTERNKSNAVIIYNNYLHQPTYKTVELFAYRLYNIERTIDVNLFHLKNPYLAIVPENQVLSVKQLFNQVNENEPNIVADNNLDVTSFQSISLNAKNDTIELNNLKHQYMNEVLTFFGINNANTDKKERLVTNEVDANNQQLLCSRDVMLNARKQACKEINEMFGLNIDVKFRNEEKVIEGKLIKNGTLNQTEANYIKEGETNE